MDGEMAFIVVKAPVPGQVKSRLAVTVGDEAAASLYRAMSTSTVRSLVQAGVPLTIAYHPPDRSADIRSTFGEDVPLIAQRGSDLGERLKNAFTDLFRGYDPVVALSSDVPELRPRTVLDAFDMLGHSDAVLGPCPDGGFYLFGFNASAFRPEAFEEIPWSTDKAAASVLQKIGGLNVGMLPELNDIDTIEDLILLFDRLGGTALGGNHDR